MGFLPKLELEPGVSESFRPGKGHTDITAMLLDVHTSVLELGVGKCRVLAHDYVQAKPPCIGFDVTQDEKDEWRVWGFFITCEDLIRSTQRLSPKVQEAIKTLPGRVRLAQMLERGVCLEKIETDLH